LNEVTRSGLPVLRPLARKFDLIGSFGLLCAETHETIEGIHRTCDALFDGSNAATAAEPSPPAPYRTGP
jgi:hypothetical protein